MKRLYGLLFIVCLFLAFASIPAIQSDASFFDRLRYHPEKWELGLTDPDHTAFRVDSESGKTMLVSFLQNHKNSVSYGWAISTFVVAAVFCAVGWKREKYFEKRRAELGDTVNLRSDHR
jgi:hypothetical protein